MVKFAHSMRATAFLAIAATALLSSCKKDPIGLGDPAPTSTTATTGTTSYVNNWILENMRDYYYWNDKIPANPNKSLAPNDFFKSLLFAYDKTTNPRGDRFSWIQESSAELQAALSGETKTTGMELAFAYKDQTQTDVWGIVLYVLPGSPADRAGFKRNDIIYAVNGTTLKANNLALAFGDGPLAFGMVTQQNGAFVNSTTTRTVSPVVFQENPVYLDSIYTVGNRKIGYLIYNQFVPGPNGSATPTYDNRINTIFGRFKSQGINELVLDLRYNGGGSVASATKLASLIVKGVGGQSNVVFSRREYNPLITTEIRKQANSAQILNDFFSNQANNVGNQLQRLYVLTTSRTASASELIVNGLRPFMTVNTIGETSAGKNVGSITLTDDENKSNKWGMQPIVFQSFNRNNESDYWTGFTPTVAVDEPLGALLPLGDTRDAMLAGAIAHIQGRTSGGRMGRVNERTVIGSTLDRKAGGAIQDLKLNR